jgi:hypothetical protein
VRQSEIDSQTYSAKASLFDALASINKTAAISLA